MNASECLIVVYVKENIEELSQLLNSINANSYFSKCNLLVMNNNEDDAIMESISKKVKSICSNAQEINKKNWPDIRKKIIDSVYKPHNRCNNEMLNLMNLGLPGWNISYARNISLIISSFLYKHCQYIIHFDSDIVISPHLDLTDLFIHELSCFMIDTCPDFSRLEWIVLYAMYINRKYNLSYSFLNHCYCKEIINKISLEDVQILINRFTNEMTVFKEFGDRSILFPTREEYHGACYIVSKDVNWKEPYPLWFDNDWYVFKNLRNNGPVQFVDKYVSHVSAKKNVINEMMLIFEEEGKIINDLNYYLLEVKDLDEANKISLCQKSVNNRLLIMKNLIVFFKKAILQVEDIIENNELNRLLEVIQTLEKHVSDINPNRLINILEQFNDFKNAWCNWFKAIRT